MNRNLAAALAALMVFSAPLLAQQTYSLQESFAKDKQYYVRCDVSITGALTVIPVKMVNGKPEPDKDKKELLSLSGKSTIAYDERILQVNADKRVERTIRAYKQLDFERKVGKQDQQSKLRPEVMRLVILRHAQYEIPFSPTRPLLWGEVDLVRTDVFVPALAGLLPAEPVAVKKSWNADRVAIQELTDLDKIDDAVFVCNFEQVFDWNKRPTAVVRFKDAKVKGVGEDGSARHELDGVIYVDLQAKFINYVHVRATHFMLDKDGKEHGKISGTLTITRGGPQTNDLSNIALQGLKLEPNADNTKLLFEHPQVGARFEYPRNWRVGVINDKQIAVDERFGSGMLISIGPSTATPAADKFFKDTLGWLSKQEAKVLKTEDPRVIQGDLRGFSFDVELGKNKERVLLQYYATRQGNQGATIAGRITPKDQQAIRGEAERIVRSLQLTGK